MNDDEVLAMYKPLVPFLAEFGGKSCEVVLHDVRHPEHSIIAIENGFHTKRKIGSPLTDFAEDVIHHAAYQDKDYTSNYNGSSKGKKFLSSTFYIKNEGRLIGMLCINRDMSAVIDFQNILMRMSHQCNLIYHESAIKETLEEKTDHVLRQEINEVIELFGVGAKMTTAEKTACVKQLMEKGILNKKGAVNETARLLDVSIPTIYRYMKK